MALFGPLSRPGASAGLAAAVTLAGVLSLPAAALAQEAGDRVELELRSGKTYSGTLVASSARAVTIRVGTSEVELPRTMVTDVRRVATPAPAERPTSPDASPRGGDAPAAAAGGVGAPAGAAAAVPRPSSILLKDGTLLEGYILSRDAGRLWVLTARPREVALDSVEEIFGNSEGMGGDGGLRITGDAARDTVRLVEELGSEDLARSSAAAAALSSYGDEAVPALLKGVRSPNTKARLLSVNILVARRPDGIGDDLVSIMKTDEAIVVRSAAAKALMYYDSQAARRALLESIWRDPEDDVKYAAAIPLTKNATVEEVSALLDLLTIVAPDSRALKPLFEALRRATGKTLGDQAGIWSNWWENEGGRDEVSEKVQDVINKRMRDLSRPR